MTQNQFLLQSASDLERQAQHARTLTARLPPDELNARPEGAWSIGQILEHLNLSSAPYLSLVREALPGAPVGGSDRPAQLSWIGKKLLKLAGPEGNAPVPKPLVPGSGPFGIQTVDHFVRTQTEFAKTVREQADRDWSAVRIRNPLVGFLRMNLLDVPALFVAHNQRHLEQIERRLK